MPKRLVYLDNAATTAVRPEVLEAMLPFLGKDGVGNPSSAHRFGRTARAAVEEAKRSLGAALQIALVAEVEGGARDAELGTVCAGPRATRCRANTLDSKPWSNFLFEDRLVLVRV